MKPNFLEPTVARERGGVSQKKELCGELRSVLVRKSRNEAPPLPLSLRSAIAFSQVRLAPSAPITAATLHSSPSASVFALKVAVLELAGGGGDTSLGAASVRPACVPIDTTALLAPAASEPEVLLETVAPWCAVFCPREGLKAAISRPTTPAPIIATVTSKIESR